MSVNIVNGNIFESTCSVLTSPVNCQGRSGAGLALQFKEKFPNEEEVFIRWCKLDRIKLGTVLTVPRDSVPNYTPDPAPTVEWICYFPTKDKPKSNSQLVDIYESLVSLRQQVVAYGLKSVALPALGCGLGGLEFARVRSAVEYIFERLPERRVDLYKPL